MALTFANALGALGYFSCVFQWMLVFATLVLPIMQQDGFRDFFMPSSPSTPMASEALNLPPFVQTILLVAAIIFSLGIIIYAIVAVPRAIGRTGSKVAHETAKAATNQIAHIQHKKLTARQRKTLTERLTWTVKLLLGVTPLTLLLIPIEPKFGVSHHHIIMAGVFCASMTLLWFGVQYLVVRFGRLNPRDVW